MPGVVEYAADKALKLNKDAREASQMMRSRRAEFGGSTLAADVCGIAMVPQARELFEALIEPRPTAVSWGKLEKTGVGEVVAGGGLHAAIYCLQRAKMGQPVGLVMETLPQLGGGIGITKKPSFYMNSRNRPGKLDLPGRFGGLNVIPGSILQPAMLSAAEWQENSDIGFLVRLALVQSAKYIALCTAADDVYTDTSRSKRKLNVVTNTGQTIRCDRVIDARGPGSQTGVYSKYTMSFTGFMQHVTRERMPFEGMKRIAVVGAGDGARCSIEAICGLGPAQHLSTSGLDFPLVDWYVGISGLLPTDCESWVTTQRSRYKAIASLLRSADRFNQAARVTVLQQNGSIIGGPDCGFVNGKPYDLVVTCIGYDTFSPLVDVAMWRANGIAVGRKSPLLSTPYYQIGVTANQDFDPFDAPEVRRVPENKDALFRLARRTMLGAATLPPVRP